MPGSPASANVFQALRGFSRSRVPEEHCDLCGARLPPQHSHLFQLSDRRILCGCDPCAILFSHRDGEARYRRIPRDVRRLRDFQISDAEWDALRLPIELAYFTRNSSSGHPVAYYPSPAGSTESRLGLDAWSQIVDNNGELAAMEPDVEALLVNRVRGRRDYFLAPIDQCYKLTGLIRIHWRGFSGGDIVWQKVDEFFKNLERQSACPA